MTPNHPSAPRWEIFAQDDPLFYIDTDSKTQEDFWRRGEYNIVTYVAPLIERYDLSKTIAIDFGCGVGRHTFPLASYAKQVIGVDISESMRAHLQRIAHERGTEKAIRCISLEEFFSLNESIGFIYSAHVFQHIEDINQIESILRAMTRVLNGYAYLHFDTRAQSIGYRLKQRLPDWILPRSQRRGIRRIRRKPEELRDMMRSLRFTICDEHNSSSQDHFFVLRYTKP